MQKLSKEKSVNIEVSKRIMRYLHKMPQKALIFAGDDFKLALAKYQVRSHRSQ